MMRKAIYSIFLCLLLHPTFAQEKVNPFAKDVDQLKVSLIDLTRGNPGIYWEHIFSDRTGVELGIGLTLDDWYSLAVYEGSQYRKREDFWDTRFMGSFAYKFRPFKQSPNLFFGVEAKYRRYFFGDGYSLRKYNVLNGVDRRETNTKVIFGGTWYPNSWKFLVEYYAGFGWFHSRSVWQTDYNYGKGSSLKDLGVFVVGLKIGFEFRNDR